MQLDPDAMSLLRRLVDESDVRQVLSELDHAVDAKDWACVRTLFDDNVTIDLPTLGGMSQIMRSDEFISLVASNNFAEKKTYHGAFSSAVRIDGDGAESRFHMYGWNQYSEMSPDFWELWGQFFFKLRRTAQGWRIFYVQQSKFHERGNPAVGTAKPIVRTLL